MKRPPRCVNSRGRGQPGLEAVMDQRIPVCALPLIKGDRKGQPATGTETGYSRHTRAGDPPCDACVKGHREYQNLWMDRNPDQRVSKNEKQKARRAVETAKRPMTVCSECGTEFFHQWAARCSTECDSKARARSSRESYWRVTGDRAFACKECGIEIERRGPQGSGRSSPLCSTCRPVVLRRTHRKSVLKRAAVLGAVRIEDYDPDEIYKRDKYRCQLCGGKIDMSKKWPHPKSPQIDHVIPLRPSDGSPPGPDTPDNVQAAHFICNLSKGNRPCGSQLRLIG